MTSPRLWPIENVQNGSARKEHRFTALPYTALVTLLICLLLFGTAANVGRARGLYGIKAPAVTGHEMFERAYRIQMNTLENAVLVLPTLPVTTTNLTSG